MFQVGKDYVFSAGTYVVYTLRNCTMQQHVSQAASDAGPLQIPRCTTNLDDGDTALSKFLFGPPSKDNRR